MRPLQELCSLNIKRIDPVSAPDEEFWYVDISSIDNKGKTIATPTLTKGKFASVRARQLIRENDVLVSTARPNLNAVALVPKKYDGHICSTGFCVLRCSDEIDPDYLFHFSRSSIFVDALTHLVQGALYPAVTDKQVFAQSIPWVPLEKQCQIAAHLKAQLTEVEKARQAAEVQLRDALALYAAILKQTFIEDSSSCWPRIELGEVGEVVAGITLGRKTNGKATRSIPYLRVANVKDGHLDLSDVSCIEATETEIERLLLRPGDILLTEGGDPDKLGRGTFWNAELKECIHQNHIFRVRFSPESYLPEFIAAQIGSVYGKDYFFAHAKKTTGIATINQKILKSFPVLSPPIEEQQIVMNELGRKLRETSAIINAAKIQLKEINVLPQKILTQAFANDSQ